MLAQLRGMAQAAAGTSSTNAPAVASTTGFAGELQKSLQKISGAQDRAYGLAEAFELGKPGVALNDVMIEMQKASISFQTAVQVRNRLTMAYQEVMNMGV
ncbi:flagellar hook-basal body complex protein FliE [Cupriavidus gilardii J11]|uniref:Flagellar hook-basal body complex protein FliE n=1 Tax=Cupriavidus gilardii J11 TaxID=936133 RepID=A0A562BVW5_9BURK|nr:flagellar hook-basal body complex protein FliE [Cupriavidus gilardii J11]